MSDNADIQRAADIIAGSRSLAILTGAGVSRESGVPTYREAQIGVWAKYDPQQLATPHAYLSDPGLGWSWYLHRRELMSSVKPNPGHHALVELEQIVPEMIVLTQNIDGMHHVAGSKDIVELHGNLLRTKCFDDCQGAPTIIDLETVDYDDKLPPPCPHCGAYLRPDVVWFTEMLVPDDLNRAIQTSQSCDVMLVVGTSGVVQPAASMPFHAKRSGATVIDVNPEPSQITPIADVFLQGPSGEVLPRVVDAVKKLRSPN
jgi:NAD-dependent deacetylase